MLSEAYAGIAELRGDIEILRECSEAERARAQRAEQIADRAQGAHDGLREQLDAALHELSELTRCAAQADGRAQGLQEML
jgi:hypothetical protein